MLFMLRVNLLDSNFVHHKNNSVAHKQHSKHIEWVRDNELVSDVCFFTDLRLGDVDRVKVCKKKVAWLLEPKAINPSIYEWITRNNRKFDFILTFDKELLDRGENFLFYPYGTTWIDPNTPLPISKTKNVSIIGSNKSMTPGHDFRRSIIDFCLSRDDVDVYGRGYNEIENKEEGLIDYRYSIVLENSRSDYYFSEKLIDCFMTKTVPIYWGCDTTKFFDQDSILTFEDKAGLENILNAVNSGVYHLLEKSLYTNYNRLIDKKINVPEDWIYTNYPFLFNII